MHDSVIVVLLMVAWLFVVVPMLSKYRQEVRRTADAALASRVLHRGDSGIRLAVRRAPARGHRSGPARAPGIDEHELDDDQDETQEVAVATQEQSDTMEQAEHVGQPEHVEQHGARPWADHVAEERELDEHYGADHHRAGRGGFDVRADAQARAARFAARRRVTGLLLAAAVVTLLGGVLGLGFLWWPHLLVDVVLVGYLTFLRRQTRIEAEVRERRLARLQRARLGVDTVDLHDAQWGSVPRRLRRPGAVVLEIDDEDPDFDELETPLAPEELRLPRAVGA